MKMQAYIDQLRAETEAANLRCKEAKEKIQCADTRVLCDIHLTDQIESLMRSLSPAQRNRPWSMEELLVRLQGRYSARPHAMNVGQALRQLGWASSRDWSAQGAGRRVWSFTSKH
jgi:hypothetical protein